MSGTPKYPQFPIRINPKIMDKLKFIAKFESRSTSKEIEHLIIQRIKAHEDKYGEISQEDIERMINEQM